MPIPPDLQIYYPNGGTQASQMYIWSGGAPVAWDGSISVSTSGSAIEDGVTSTIKATVIDLLTGGGASNPLAVAIVDTTGAQIASFGGGTQYVEGVTTSPATGTVFLWRKAGGNLVAVDATNKLPVVGPLTDTELRATAVPISAASLPLPTGAATAANQQTDALTDTQLRASAVPVSAASLPLPALAATSTKQSDGSQKTQIVDGSGNVIGSTSNALDINIKSGNPTTITVTQATATNLKAEVVGTGTFAVQATAVGTIADDSTTPGNPVMIGGTAKETDGTDPGSVSAEDDVTRAITDRNRRLLVNIAHPNLWKVFEDHTTAQTNNQLKAAPGANLSLYITDIIFSNGATAGSIKLVEDESGTPVQLTQTVYMTVNGGAVMHFITPIRMTTNKSLGFTSTTVTTHSVEVHGYIAP